MRNKNLDNNSYVLVTGATGGLGKAFCFELAKLNYKLYITGTSDEKLSKLKDELLVEFPSLDIKSLACDLSNFENRVDFINNLKENKINIDFLINNAGFITEGSINNAKVETLLKCIQVNCEGTIHLTKALLDIKSNDTPFNIICVTSMASNYPMPYMAIYSATKSLIKNFMLALRQEYIRDNVNVLIVEPGAIATSENMKEAIKSQGLKGKLSSVEPSKIAKNSIKKVFKGKKKYVPGFFNKLTLFVSKLAPISLQTKAIARMWRKSQDKRNIK
ncbi:MAG: SDR family NAD(P)-dependent oxidoreductase [Christensenellales bacterium]